MILRVFFKRLLVRCAFPETKLSRVDEILDNPALEYTTPQQDRVVLPFVNAKYRARVRVVDFYPKSLEEFTSPTTEVPFTQNDDILMEDQSRWDWRFVLLVEDTISATGDMPQRMRLTVPKSSAEFLLKMDPVWYVFLQTLDTSD